MKTNQKENEAPKSFKIRAEHIPAAGLNVSETLGQSFVNELINENGHPVSWKCVDSVRFDATVDHEADMLRLCGGGEFHMVYPCIRCLEEISFKIRVEFNSRLLPREKDPDQDKTEVEVEVFDDCQSMAGEMENYVVSYFDNGIIDLTQLLREQLFLEFPEYPTCGISEHPRICDLSLLESINVASEDIIEHPFAKLKNWKASIAN